MPDFQHLAAIQGLQRVSNNFFSRFRKNKDGDSPSQGPETQADDSSESGSVAEKEPRAPAAEATSEPAATEPAAPESEPASESGNEAAPEAEASGGFFARFRKSAGDTASDQPEAGPENPEPVADEAPTTPAEQEKPASGFFARLKSGLSRTSSNFADGLGNLFLGRKEIDEELLEDVETQLLVADVGIDATTTIVDRLTEAVRRRELSDAGALYRNLKGILVEMLQKVEAPMQLPENKTAVILVVGVNGVGKTTTIGKLSKRLQGEGKSVMLAAGDTFRAAAVEQLQVWGERNDIPVVAQHTGADSASVIYDAIASAQARGADVVIADTAGRLHNKSHLMDELSKVKRVMAKLDDSAPHEVLLVLDAGTGQNALNQAQQFVDAAGVTGLALTKLDGTAKGGVIFALSEKFGLPVRFIGVGEGVNDLQPFVAEEFVEALFQGAAE
ncbi:signal recognition particle-docking protein FtsY [Pseudomaricurvus sp. HS19]|nr:signal recognition particle-docking protein FtsY [Pseudomaricurvus sp. HS19]